MLKFNLNYFSMLAELEKQGNVSHAVKSFLVLNLLSLFKTSHFLLSTQSNHMCYISNQMYQSLSFPSCGVKF